MEWVHVCVWVTTFLAAQQNRLSLAVLSDGPPSPPRAGDQLVCPRGIGWALGLTGRSKLGGPLVSHQLIQRALQPSLHQSSCEGERLAGQKWRGRRSGRVGTHSETT